MDRAIRLFLLVIISVFISCASTRDVERVVQSSTKRGKQFDPTTDIIIAPIEQDPVPPIIIEKPIYIPQESPPAAAAAPPHGMPAVQAATRAIVEPQDFSNSAMLYDFDRDFVYEVYCRPFRVTDITLAPGETVMGPPFVSDSERFMLGAGVSYEDGFSVQHIYVKPTVADITATLIINTDTRVYHLILRSFNNVHMPIVRWRYHNRDMPQNYGSPRSPAYSGAAAPPFSEAFDDSAILADARYLSFNYKITWGFFKKPRWLPNLVYDDGRKTYITFPDLVPTMDMPTVFEDRADILNYRVNQNVMIIDKLIEKITIKLGDRVVTVEKKRGKK